VLSENFDSDGVTLNWAGDSVFQSVVQNNASVDLVGVQNGYGELAYSGNSLDLDGSTGYGRTPIAGEIQSVADLALGDYTVSFLLAGNLRDADAQTTVVGIGDKTFDFTPAASQAFTSYTLHFTGASGHLSFLDMGPSDQRGNLLDNILVTTGVTGVPEPAVWTMMLVGLFGIGGMLRRSRDQALGQAQA
jgi:hypothetical protein